MILKCLFVSDLEKSDVFLYSKELENPGNLKNENLKKRKKKSRKKGGKKEGFG